MNDTTLIAQDAFLAIRKKFPHLNMTVEESHEHVELLMTIPMQEGLDFGIELNLQNEDELHLCVGAFWNNWFPCTDAHVVDAYIGAVSGLITGQIRVYEHHRGKRAVCAELQSLDSGTWKTISTWSTLALPWPKKHYCVVQNMKAD